MIRLPVPPSTNQLYRGRRYKTNEYKAWQEYAGHIIKPQINHQFDCPVVASLLIPENNYRDLDNYLKPTFDLLVNSQVIRSDRCRWLRGISAVWHDGEDVEVTIERAVL